jgi:hypothetical protein
MRSKNARTSVTVTPAMQAAADELAALTESRASGKPGARTRSGLRPRARHSGEPEINQDERHRPSSARTVTIPSPVSLVGSSGIDAAPLRGTPTTRRCTGPYDAHRAVDAHRYVDVHTK